MPRVFSQDILVEPANTGNIITLLKEYDLSDLLHPKSTYDYLTPYDGVIGDKCRRIQVIYSSVQKTDNPYVYFVEGKSKVGVNIFPFVGEIVLTAAAKTTAEILDDDAEQMGRVNGLVKGNYFFRETTKEKSTGIFKGEVELIWGMDQKGNIVSSRATNYVARPFTVNYQGVWESYNSGNQLTCCWSDYRIPCVPDDFDLSDGPDIIPNEKYSGMGWENVRILSTRSSDTPEWKKAYEAESTKWWE